MLSSSEFVAEVNPRTPPDHTLMRVEKTRPTGMIFESHALGGDFQDFSNIPLSNFIKLDYSNVNDMCNRIERCLIESPDTNILKKLHFLTVNPSPEFMYFKYKNLIMSYKTQLLFFERLFKFVSQQTGTTILSISAEKGKKSPGPLPILHYHLILLQSSTRKFKQFYTAIRNQVTVLHEIKGFQTSLKESEVQAQNLITGIKYFNGINKNVNAKLKPDYYMSYPFYGLA